jgi:hypothetical protein
METAKVDIRKLQVLNDCINRTIEALNQVRLSVHAGGLSHSAALGALPFFGGYPTAGYPSYPNVYGASVYGAGIPQAVGYPQYAQSLGLGHTAAMTGGYWPSSIGMQSAYGSPIFGAQSAYGAPLWGNPAAAAYGAYGPTGLGHSAPSAGVAYEAYADPFIQSRIGQTFPFVQWGYSPYAWPTV